MFTDYLTFRGTGWFSNSNASSLLNVRYSTDNTIPDAEQISKGDYTIFFNPRAVPRAFLVSRYRTFENEQKMLQWISTPLFSPGQTVLLLKSDISKLPASFLKELFNENDDLQVKILSQQQGEQNSIWGWSSEDHLQLLVRPQAAITNSFLTLNYYSKNELTSHVKVQVKDRNETKEMIVELEGIGKDETQWQRLKNKIIDLGSLKSQDYELTIIKMANCDAYIDSIRVSKFNSGMTDSGTVHIASYEPNQQKVNADAKRNSFLVLSELYYPGWQTKINSEKAVLLKGNFTLRVVPLLKGKNQIEIQYRPKSFLLGLTISLATLISAFIVLLAWKNKS
jgi:uncharacterized membrane protein YfhO